MKKLIRNYTILLSFIFLHNIPLYSQDIAVRLNGDTLRGKITFMGDYILMKMKKYPNLNGISIPMMSLKTYVKNYYNDTISVKIKVCDLMLLKNGDSLKVNNLSKTETHYYYNSMKANYLAIPVVSVSGIKSRYSIDTVFTIKPGKISAAYSNTAVIVVKSGKADTSSIDQGSIQIPAPKKNEISGYLRIALDAGYIYRLAQIPSNIGPQLSEHYSKLKGGFGFNASLAYYFTQNIGLGFDYLFFKTSDEIYYLAPGKNSNANTIPISGNLNEDILINHYTPYVSFSANLDRGKAIKYFLNLGFSYQTYTDAIDISNSTVSMSRYETGSTFGGLISNQFDFLLHPNIAFGLRVDYVSGLLSKTNVTVGNTSKEVTYNPDQSIGLGRVNASIGLKFYVF